MFAGLYSSYPLASSLIFFFKRGGGGLDLLLRYLTVVFLHNLAANVHRDGASGLESQNQPAGSASSSATENTKYGGASFGRLRGGII